MYNTDIFDDLSVAMIDLVTLINSPKRDHTLLQEAGVELDRALFALLVLLDMKGAASVGDLSDWVGRDSTTVSRQLSKLESLDLVARATLLSDRRIRVASLTKQGAEIVTAISAARKRLLSRALADWSAADHRTLADLTARLVLSLRRGGGDAS